VSAVSSVFVGNAVSTVETSGVLVVLCDELRRDKQVRRYERTRDQCHVPTTREPIDSECCNLHKVDNWVSVPQTCAEEVHGQNGREHQCSRVRPFESTGK
jgi:hypothetical protein